MTHAWLLQKLATPAKARIALAVTGVAVVAGCSSGPTSATSPSPKLSPTQDSASKAVAKASEHFEEAREELDETVFTVPGDGTFLVVENATQGEIWPGQWETSGPADGEDGCTWDLYSPDGEVIEVGLITRMDGEVTGDTVVTIEQVGSSFGTSDCADWKRVKE